MGVYRSMRGRLRLLYRAIRFLCRSVLSDGLGVVLADAEELSRRVKKTAPQNTHLPLVTIRLHGYKFFVVQL